MKKTIFICFLMMVSAIVAFGGSYYWCDGEIVRGVKINSALDEKLDTNPVLKTSYDVLATNTIVIPVGRPFVRVIYDGASASNLLSLTTANATEGTFIYIYNNDTENLGGAVATITPGHMGAVFFASGSWRLMWQN